MASVFVVDAHWNNWEIRESNGVSYAFSDIESARKWCEDHVYYEGGYNYREHGVYYSAVAKDKVRAQASIHEYELDPEPQLPGFEEWKKPPVYKNYCGGAR